MKTELAPRTDPIVWSGGKQRNDDVERYARDGFILYPSFFSESNVKLFSELCRTLQEKAEPPQKVLESNGATHSVWDIPAVSDRFLAELRNSKLIEIAKEILGGDVYLHQSHVNYKPKLGGTGFDWHSDFSFWQDEDGMILPRALSIFIYVDAQKVENGPLLVIPGSHRYLFPKIAKISSVKSDEAFQSKTRNSISRETWSQELSNLVETFGITDVCAPAGSVMLMDACLVHGSSANISTGPRRMMACCLNSTENPLGAPLSGKEPRPNFITKREIVPL